MNSIEVSKSQGRLSHKRYSGEMTFRLSYEGNTGPWMRWLHVDFEKLKWYASKYGWSTKRLIQAEEGGFLARLNPGL